MSRKKANELGLVRKPWVKSSFAPGSKVARLYLEEAGLLPELEKVRFLVSLLMLAPHVTV
ncbi:hypothetical protein QW180_00550 [Vibrio sinaloensis]|nr:hypothetical protein [Vibrio sinaloensis]